MTLAGNRILIVEDESLVALSLTETLTQLGFDVVGPFGTIADARAALSSEHIDAAILDVNLNGEMIYPLAENLVQRELPFIFITGYGPESIDKRFGQIPVMQKPVDRDGLHRLFAVNAKKKEKSRRAAVAGGPAI